MKSHSTGELVDDPQVTNGLQTTNELGVHTVAWIVWLLATLLALSLTRNPFYLILTLLCALIVSMALYKEGVKGPLLFSPLKVVGFILLMAPVFNGLTSHFGETTIFVIPGHVPYLSGNVNCEALVYGLINGLVISGMFVAFTALNQALSVRALIRLTPRAFYPLAIVTSVAITFVPTTLRQYRQIRDAQAIRGHRIRSLRDWLPLLLPLLVSGLERALQLSEAMMARGFASDNLPKHQNYIRLPLLASMVLVPSGWLISLVEGMQNTGTALALTGTILILLSLWLTGRRMPRSTYRKKSWNLRSAAIVLGSALTLIGLLLPLPIVSYHSLIYTPYPSLNLPVFDPFIGILLLSLLTPALVAGVKST